MQTTIIIPVLNEAARIGSLVRYLWAHSEGTVAEILVVDGGSSDDTVAVAAAAGSRVLHCPVRSRAAQMNAGARQATTDWLWFIHADTTPPPSFAVDLSAVVQEGRDAACYRYRFDSPSLLLRVNSYFNRFSMLWCQGGDKTFFIRKDIFQALGGYNEHFVIMEEYDFLKRMCPRHPLFIIPKNAVVSARKYEQNSWLRVQLANTLTFTLFRLGAAPALMKKFYRKMLR
ncbi:MAG: TIGR04283 family arsenosugar biosynthesis glycosyltransferase [Saprospiraceae bacterium]|nr:TIGR04283 family arsenosugar biosynthesis glycosyltransferase [Saprospiraceae bacterium]